MIIIKIKLHYFILLIFLLSLFVYTSFYNQMISYGLIAFSFGLILLILLKEKQLQNKLIFYIKNNIIILFSFLIYWIITLVNLKYEFTFNKLLFTFGYLFSFLIVFYILPILSHRLKDNLPEFFVGVGIFFGTLTFLFWGLDILNLNFINFKMYRTYKMNSIRLPAFQSIFYNVNAFGSIIYVSLFSSIYLYFVKTKKIINRYLFISIYLFIIFLFTWARSSYVALFISVFLIPFFNKKTRKKFLIISLSFLIFLNIFILINPNYFDFGKRFLQLDKSYTRSYINEASIQLISKKPFFGYGEVDFSELLYPHLPVSLKGIGPHNTYFKTILSVGLIGFFFYIIIILISIKKGIKLSRMDSFQSQWALLIVIGMLVHFYFEIRSLGGFGYVALIYTFLLGNINYSYFLYINKKHDY